MLSQAIRMMSRSSPWRYGAAYEAAMVPTRVSIAATFPDAKCDRYIFLARRYGRDRPVFVDCARTP